MKEVLEKFGLSEFFGFVLPGAIFLSSLYIWIRPDFGSNLWKREIFIVILFLSASYAVGLGLASYVSMAPAPYAFRTKRPDIPARFWEGLMRVLYYFPAPQVTPRIVELNLRIAGDLERLTGMTGLSSLAKPWEWLVVYRTLLADQIGDEIKTVLTEAETLHNRFLFCMGVALAVFLVAVQALCRLLLIAVGLFLSFVRLPPVEPGWLVATAILGLWLSYELRRVAIRMWELERYLTASLAERFHQVQLAPPPGFQGTG